jgi:hypothetical protein
MDRWLLALLETVRNRSFSLGLLLASLSTLRGAKLVVFAVQKPE